MNSIHERYKAISSLVQLFEIHLDYLSEDKGFVCWIDHEKITNDIFGIMYDDDVKLMRLGNFYVVTDVADTSPWIEPVKYCAERGLLFTITFNANNESVRTDKWYFSGRTPEFLLDHSVMKILGQSDLYTNLQNYIEVNDMAFEPDHYEKAVLELSPISASVITWAHFGMPLSSMPEMNVIENVDRRVTDSEITEDNGRENIYQELVGFIKKFNSRSIQKTENGNEGYPHDHDNSEVKMALKYRLILSLIFGIIIVFIVTQIN